MKNAITFLETALAAMKTLQGCKSADKIADYFAKNKIKGDTGYANNCPIVNFFKKKIKAPEDARVEVEADGDNVTIRCNIDENSSAEQTVVSFKNTPAMTTFISRFDSTGDYDKNGNWRPRPSQFKKVLRKYAKLRV